MKLLREPLAHFLVAGTLLFAGHAWLNRGTEHSASEAAGVVRLTANEVEWLKQSWTRQWQRPPAGDELKGLVADYLKEELLSREARALRLDVDDTIVRRRLAQKMSFLVEDTARVAAPSDDELRRFYEADRGRFQSPARVTFRHIFFNRDRQGGAAAAQARQRLANSDASVDVATLGDRFLLEYEFADSDERTITNLFGREFARRVFALETRPMERAGRIRLRGSPRAR
jgi:parvulin-like peptidyl-prolyl cis-trans isomerase-like protein